MPTIETGDASNITTPVTRSVQSVSGNAVSPIVVTTTVPHGFGSGDYVTISGVGGNTNANGISKKITVLSSTSFSVVGTGNANYTSGGTVVDLSLTPQFQVPSGGDPRTVASILTAIDALADRTQYLSGAKQVAYTATGSAFTATLDLPIGNYFPALVQLAENVKWVENRISALYLVDYEPAHGADLGVVLSSGGATTQSVVLVTSGFSDLIGDILECELSTSSSLVCSSGSAGLTVDLELSQNGGGYAAIPNASQAISTNVVSVNTFPISIVGYASIATAGTYAIRATFTLSGGGAAASSGFPYVFRSRLLRNA